MAELHVCHSGAFLTVTPLRPAGCSRTQPIDTDWVATASCDDQVPDLRCL